jgi:putative mRNA 3-end processing factor
MPITGIGLTRFPKCCNRGIALAKLVADFAKREPGGGKGRRQLGRLLQQIGRGRKIALELEIAREFVPAVGDQIAGGQEQARGHFWADLGCEGESGTRMRLASAYINDMRPQDILTPQPAGLCCKPGGFHIDPVRPVERAVITHGHSDHARAGHGAVLATRETLDMMRLRYGENFARSTQAVAYGEEVRLGDVTIKFHPAGHVLGSAQIAVTCNGTRVVASGDYKDAPDPTCSPFEVVPCDVFITEATFGLPVFRHGDATDEVNKLLASARLFPERAHLVGAYSLGKAQRVIALLRAAGYDAPIYLHGAMEKITHYYQSRGIALGELRPVKGVKKADLAGTITLAPPSATSDVWTRRFPDPVTAFASGWMRVRARARQGGIELPLVISDHADWDGLTATIKATGAGEIWVTHGQEDALVHWCKTQGLAARPLDLVGYGDEDSGEGDVQASEGEDA